MWYNPMCLFNKHWNANTYFLQQNFVSNTHTFSVVRDPITVLTSCHITPNNVTKPCDGIFTNAIHS